MRARATSESGLSPETDLIFLDDGRPAELPGFDPYFGYWIEELRKEKAQSTIKVYARAIPLCIASLQSICSTKVTLHTMSSLRPTVFEEMQQSMHEEGAADRTIQIRMAALRNFGKFLGRNGYEGCAILLLSRLRDFQPRSLHTPGEEDCNSLMAMTFYRPEDSTWEMVRNRAVLTLISTHGLKMSEVVAIDREHLCFEQHILSVVAGLQPRTIPVSAQAVDEITAYVEVCPYQLENGSPLFRGTRGGRLIARVVQLATKALRNQLGLHEETTARTVRKSLVLQMVAKGVSIQQIMMRVGISASAIDAILRESPLSPLAIEEAVHQAELIIKGIRFK
jgi:integrase/recombinase XerC